METTEAATRVDRIVIWRVEIGKNETTYTKEAPRLPDGVTWHRGCVIDLCDEEYVDVDMVVVKEDGSVIVWLERVSDVDEELLVKNGWAK